MNKYTLIRTVLGLGLGLLGPVAGAQTCNPALSPTAAWIILTASSAAWM